MFSYKEKFAIRWSYPSRLKLNLILLLSKILFVSLTFKSADEISVVLLFKLNFFGTVKPQRPHFSSKFNPLNTDTPLIRTLKIAPSVSVLTRFDKPNLY